MDKAEEVLKKEIDKLDFKDGVSEPELTRNSMDAFPIVAYSFTNKNDDLKPQQKKLMTNLFLNYKQLMAFRMLNLMVKTTRQVTLKFKQNKLDEGTNS